MGLRSEKECKFVKLHYYYGFKWFKHFFLFKFEVNCILIIKKKAHIICCTFSHILPHSARPTTEFAVLKLDIYIELRKQECAILLIFAHTNPVFETCLCDFRRAHFSIALVLSKYFAQVIYKKQ